MDRKFLVALAFACIVVAAAPSWGQDARPAPVTHNQRG
jgi:hypothetical protein